MWVIDVPGASLRLRGILSRWAVEVRAGLFVGTAGARARDKIWKMLEEHSGAGTSAVMIVATQGGKSYELRTCGDSRNQVVDIDGMQLVSRGKCVVGAKGEGD